MAKYYVESDQVRLILDAPTPAAAAVRTFQWSCDRQNKIEAATPLEHAAAARRLGLEMGDEVHVSERGFGRWDGIVISTLEVLLAWESNASS